MHRLFLFSCIAVLLTGCGLLFGPVVEIEDVPAMVLPTPVQIRTAGGTMCNGVRLDGQTVATAAHCLADGTNVSVIEAEATLRPSAVQIHPAYEFLDRSSAAGLDLAKIFVEAPFGAAGEVVIAPLQAGPVEILVRDSAGEFRNVRCEYLGQSGTLTEVSCLVRLGWSGAPVVQNGALVGLLSARGQRQTAGVAQIADATRLDSF
ncbi:S1 family peptidase [Octadecabacter sp. G9-8]|uniref:S1 family peptidase n=1 Tax=Octadecabacter dasysiphoniae TaxID=2909341 RepID=A0ABS9CXR5_9RHOB|nr:trypsin-like serine protease [Octadecabacter dasysiphoniae]MCF2872060.1 S1 family peptidase [Octadecabacter dasysiphoniae]